MVPMPGHSASSPVECRKPGTLVRRTDSTYSPFCSYSAMTRPAGVSRRSTPGVFGRTSPCSIATARLEHQAGADPIELGQEMLALLAHVGANQLRAAAHHHPHRVAAGVRV